LDINDAISSWTWQINCEGSMITNTMTIYVTIPTRFLVRDFFWVLMVCYGTKTHSSIFQLKVVCAKRKFERIQTAFVLTTAAVRSILGEVTRDLLVQMAIPHTWREVGPDPNRREAFAFPLENWFQFYNLPPSFQFDTS
jgi:hypothetical protein